jgi:DNA-binding beta-propeller fold protein YncE
MKKINIVILVLLFSGISVSLAQSKYQISNKIHLTGNNGWDYISVDEDAARLYVSHGTEVNVVDLTRNESIGIIPDTKGVHGIAVAKDLNKGFISNGRDTSVTVIDLKTLAFITKIKVTGNNPDAILYDPFTKRVFTFNGRSSNSTVIDAVTYKILETIPLPGKPEFSVTDFKGTVYVNIETKNLVCKINSKTMKMEQSWSIAPGEEPSGLAFDLKNNRLFSVCSNKLMVVSNPETGKVVTTLPIGDGCDGVAFDPILKRIYSANGEGNMTIVEQKDANTYVVLENLPTQKSARTITVNTKTHKIYLPAAEYGEAPAPTAENPRPRSPLKPNTFVVLEISTK